jgi:hypothetical protein
LSSIPNPSLDDISFEILVETAKKKIPLYSKVWTNHNLADPGITLIELFAWLADNQIYSLDRISDKHYIKFLKLLGITLQDPVCPQLYLTIDLKSLVQKNNESLLLRKGSKFKSRNSNDIVIETDHDINIISSLKVKKIVTFSNSRFFNHKFRDISENFQKLYESYFYPFGENPKVNNCFYLGFDLESSSEKKEDIQISFTFFLYENDLPPIGFHGDEKDSEYLSELESTLKWEYLKEEKDSSSWSPLKISIDDTNSLLKTGSITFSFPKFESEKSNAFRNIPYYNDDNNYKLFWIRCTIIENKYPIAPRIMNVLPNTVKCTFGEKIIDKLRNKSLRLYDNSPFKSNGLVNQLFEVSSKTFLPIITIESLKVDDKEWSEVQDLDRSTAKDTHFTVDKVNGIFRFGDGENGMVPKRGSEIEVKFRFGSTDNLVIRENTNFEITDSKCDSSSNFNSNLKGLNLLPSSKGKKRETIQDAIIRARRDLKIPYKIVSSADCEYIARNTPGLRIGKVKAMSSPKYQNTIEVSVIPFDFSQKPNASKYFLSIIRKHLDKHRLITTRILVKKPKYIGIIVEVTVSLKSSNNESENIRKKVYDLLDNLFRPINRENAPRMNGSEPNYRTSYHHLDNSGWNFGQNIYRSELIGKIESLEEIDCIYDLNLDAVEDKSSEIEDKNNFDKSKDFINYDIYSTSYLDTTTNFHRSFDKYEGNIIIHDLNLVYLKSLNLRIIPKLSADKTDFFNVILHSDKLNKISSSTKDLIKRDNSLPKGNTGRYDIKHDE